MSTKNSTEDKNDILNQNTQERINNTTKGVFKIVVIDIRGKFNKLLKDVTSIKDNLIYRINRSFENIHLPKLEVCAVREHTLTKLILKYLCVFGATACIVLGLVKINPRLAVVVSINNTPITVVPNRLEFEEILYKLQQEWKNSYNEDILLNGIPKFKLRFLPSRVISNKKQIALSIESNTNLLKKTYGISVNGKIQSVVKDKDSALQVLSNIKKRFSNVGNAEFFEDVKVEEIFVPDYYVQNTDDAFRTLTVDIGGNREYKVKKGDTLWDIAQNNKIPIEKLYELNPNISENLKIGQTISFAAPKSTINVKTIECVEVTEKSAFNTKFQNDSNKYKGDKKVLVSGEYGEKILKVEIIKQNGVEIEKSVIDEKVIKEPKPEVVAIGTKDRKKYEPRGSFRVPVFGSVTSRYGYRWGRIHEGVDISGNIGDSIYAADAGKVIFSGSESGYGNIVKIDHGNGYVTYYGHNSKNLVKVGQMIDKGYKIALLGNTGRSTGPHVHFEVRKNGIPQDPLKYLK